MAKLISALNETGQGTDWWFIYKVPHLAKDDNGDSVTGYEYFYYDVEAGKLTKSPYVLTQGEGALDLTLKSLFFSPAATTGWILYNDEMPAEAQRKDVGSYGHTKGVLAFDTASKTAFWLLHSWPKFASPTANGMPVPNYGQTYLCVSIDLDTAGTIAQQMINHQEPQVYSSRIPDTLDKKHPLYLLSQPFSANAIGDSDVISCSTRGGLKFKVIAKNRKWGKDFWNDLVGPTLKADMELETWIRGAIPSTMDADGVHRVYDVKFIDFNPLGYPYKWSETHDHAKWGLTVESDWICVGDINRMVSQEKRGGGTIALQDKKLWSALKQTDLLVPPPGKTIEHAKAIIKSTHQTKNHGT